MGDAEVMMAEGKRSIFFVYASAGNAYRRPRLIKQRKLGVA